MLFGEIIAVYCENYTERINTLCGQNTELYYLKYNIYDIIMFYNILLYKLYVMYNVLYNILYNI
jgi:hypothetical protein